MPRIVQPELLDQLPACNIDAIASRRDLVKINALMGNYRWIRTRLFLERTMCADRYLEVGAGDGTLAHKLLRKLPPNTFSALDLAPEPPDWPHEAQWIRRDLLRLESLDTYSHLIANLFLHHFEADGLQKIGELIQNSSIRALIVSEPCRRSFHKYQLRAGKWIGFNYVTLNDGSISVDAGFRGNELPELLQLSRSEWQWTINETIMGAYRMHAQRR